MAIARGPLGVTTEGELPFLERDGNKLIRTIVRKDFSGDMIGTSEAQMVAAYTGTPGSAGYVAIEHFTGSVGGNRVPSSFSTVESWPTAMPSYS